MNSLSEHLIRLRGLWSIVIDSQLGHRPDNTISSRRDFQRCLTLSRAEQEAMDKEGWW